MKMDPESVEEIKAKRRKRPRAQGAVWRKLDNTAKLMAAVSGEDLSNVFRICPVLKKPVRPELLEQALSEVLEEFPMFRVRLRRGFFWNYFETNNREPMVEEENTFPCKYIDPHGSSHYLFRVSYYKNRINLEVFHALTDGMGAIQFAKRLTVRYLELELELESELESKLNAGPAEETEIAESKEEAETAKIEEYTGTLENDGMAERTETSGTDGVGWDARSSGGGKHSGDRIETASEAEAGDGKVSVETAEAEKVKEKETVKEKAKEKTDKELYVDGYLKHYKKREKNQEHRRYGTERAMTVVGERLPLDSQNIVHGYVDLKAVKCLCRAEGVSVTKYVAGLLIWSLICVYGKGKELEHPAALNLPINLRNFFDSETMANFFAVTNISWQDRKRPESFEAVLQEAGRQMDEKIVRKRLEETISYNVSNEKKWYVRIVPLIIKNMVMNNIFVKSSRAYTMTFSNLGPVSLDPEWDEKLEHFNVFIGVSGRQPLKCTLVAFKEQLCVTFDSVMDDTALSDFFFKFLEDRGVAVELESNGVTDQIHDRGTYPQVSYDEKQTKKLLGLFYLALLTAAVVIGAVNLATYEYGRSWWSLIAVGGIAYAALTVRYSIMRRSSIAGILLVQSLGAHLLLILIDLMTGFHGWSFNYAIPSLILFDVIAIVFLIVVNRLNWQSYFMYQIAITIFSFIPLILWAAGLVTKPLMAVITTSLSVAVLIVTIILGDRSVKKELKRRFHF